MKFEDVIQILLNMCLYGVVFLILIELNKPNQSNIGVRLRKLIE